MNWKNTSAGFGWPAMLLHWVSLLLVAAAFALMEFKSIYPRGSAGRAAMMDWHYSVGMWVFGLTALRLLLRLPGSVPRIEPLPPLLQQRMATAMHGALYAWLVLLPVLGWLSVSASGEPVQVLGMHLPALVETSRKAAHDWKEIHEGVATAGYALIGLHAAAALFHHHFMRDSTLRLMLPRR